MKRLLLAIAVFASLALQETTLPADHYCLAGPPQNARGHECACKRICEVDENGAVTDRESSECKMFCRRSSCVCHADESCRPPKG